MFSSYRNWYLCLAIINVLFFVVACADDTNVGSKNVNVTMEDASGDSAAEDTGTAADSGAMTDADLQTDSGDGFQADDATVTDDTGDVDGVEDSSDPLAEDASDDPMDIEDTYEPADTEAPPADVDAGSTPPDSDHDSSSDVGGGGEDAEDTDVADSPDAMDGEAPLPFPAILDEGLWLIGWHGGLEHFSWVRFDFVDRTRGSVEVRDPRVEINAPFLPCEGTGLFTTDPDNLELVLQAPVCMNDVIAFRFAWGQPTAPPEWLSGALLAVPLVSLDGDAPANVAYLFPSDFCDEAPRSCRNPFQ